MGGARGRAYAIDGNICSKRGLKIMRMMAGGCGGGCGCGIGREVMMLMWHWWGGGDMMMKVLTDGDGSRGGGMIVGVRR
ncbi:hypothetical protein Tco_0630874 [Tanacetum coccineum]